MIEPEAFSGDPGPESAIVVLGCRVVDGEPGNALWRRLSVAAEMHRTRAELPVILSGGRAWDGHTECAVMARWWSENARPAVKLILESESQTTRENAARVAQICKGLSYRHIILVTCDFHMRRAQHLFEKQALRVTPVQARKVRSLGARLRLALREWGATLLALWESAFR